MIRPLITVLASLFILICNASVIAQSIEDSYTIIRPVQPTQTEDKIEIVEIFYYGCGGCYSFEPHLQRWLQTKPDNTEFRRIPAVFNKAWIPLAKAYYTAIKLGVLEKTHQKLFDAIHKNKRNIFDDVAIKAFFIKQGVDGDEFSRVYNSMEINTKIRQADVMGRKYRVPSVPAIIINGKYLTGPAKARSNENLFKVMNILISKESTGS